MRGMGDGIEEISMAEHSGEMSFICPRIQGKEHKGALSV